MMKTSRKNADKLIADFLRAVGEDPSRTGLEKTPGRVVAMYKELLSGYRQEPRKVLNGATFAEKYNEMVVVRDIDFYSMCEHHLIPFFGKCHVAYIPNGRIVGLSKIARLVEVFSRRLQVQERMTQQVAETIDDVLHPQGVAVVAEAKHLCMVMRGVEKINSVATTSAMLGLFHDDVRARTEFLSLIGRPVA